ncbi:MAG: hypothetical protein ACOCUI_04305, partial [bacterium]
MFSGLISGIGSALGLYKTYKDIEDGASGGTQPDPEGLAWNSFMSKIKDAGLWTKYKSLSDKKRAATWAKYKQSRDVPLKSVDNIYSVAAEELP